MKSNRPLDPASLSRNHANLIAAGFDPTHPLRVIACTWAAPATPTFKRGERMYVLALRDGQVRVFGRRKTDRVWTEEWQGVWKLANYRVRVLGPETNDFKFRKLHRVYAGVEPVALQESVNTIWVSWQWHADTRYRYLHQTERVDGAVYSPGWIDAWAYPWVFVARSTAMSCGLATCPCEGRPVRAERP